MLPSSGEAVSHKIMMRGKSGLDWRHTVNTNRV